MKKRIISLALALSVAVSLLIGFSITADAVYFTSVDDKLLELDDSTMPVVYGNLVYVPYTVFTSGSFKIYASSFSTGGFMLFNSNEQLYFDIENGVCSDSNGTEYPVSAIIRNGTAYVPAQFTSIIFGLKYSYIETDYGPIVRIKSSSAVLSDSVFADAAESLMRSRLNAYNSGRTGENEGSTLEDSQLPDAEDLEDEEEEPTPVVYSDVTLNLMFAGISDETVSLLDALDSYGFSVCFFVTPQEIKSFPETVRLIVCRGFLLGILCESAEDFEEGNELLFDAVMERTNIAAFWSEVPEGVYASAWVIGEDELISSEISAEEITAGISITANEKERLLFYGAEYTDTLKNVFEYIYEYQYNIEGIDELTEVY